MVQYSKLIDEDFDQRRRPDDYPKMRRCLRCEKTFLSSWSGERICPHCKTTAAWRQGAPMPSYHTQRRR